MYTRNNVFVKRTTAHEAEVTEIVSSPFARTSVSSFRGEALEWANIKDDEQAANFISSCDSWVVSVCPDGYTDAVAWISSAPSVLAQQRFGNSLLDAIETCHAQKVGGDLRARALGKTNNVC